MDTEHIDSLRFRTLWLSAGLVLLVALFVIALLPLSAPLPGRSMDKVLHALAFFLLMVWFTGVVKPKDYLKIFIALLLYGAAMEIAQGFTRFRYMEFMDFVADGVGLVLGWLGAWMGLARWPAWIERILGLR